MSLVTRLRLPRRSVPGNLSHQWFRAPAVFECRRFFMSPKNTQHTDAPRPVIRPQITPTLLPYAIALVEATRLPRPLVGSSVAALLDALYSRPDRLAAHHSVRQLPNDRVRQINSAYEMMDTMTADFAACALKRISPSGRAMSTRTPLLSPAEHFRFCRAFYRVELFHTLFGGGRFADEVNCWFLSRHAPWENEQLACVYSYLGTKLDPGLLAHCKRRVFLLLWRSNLGF
jgi:hypothetical protein